MTEEIEIRIIDRTGWPAGPWDNEPTDREEWRDDATGLPCLALRGRLGNWCGYTAVPPGHPWHGVDKDDIDCSVHGGLTYAGECWGHICHIPAEGEPADVYWLGFDCAHFQDLVPGMLALGHLVGLRLDRYGTYKTLGYIKKECADLAAQVIAAR